MTFVAYSVGAYVVESALKKLHEAGDKGKNIVERVVFISAPLSTSEETWNPMREVVSGRIVKRPLARGLDLNVLLPNKECGHHAGSRGLQPVEHNDVENYEMPLKHARIPDKISEILARRPERVNSLLYATSNILTSTGLGILLTSSSSFG